ncbi:hypothetical protein ST37_09440 [Vibrio sp. qd031]|uniref:peptidoglycan binding protein CsiV n=1 Tax=Vibrio sp. qd031 TaxID=1603038 RepID=UPI000A10022A|nr:peptidoglycan binding protein CsiV [Vibrio sp. qd031]ORT50130.1 hypothetical protein ST37_09440 [Vibrio sp. qd031]
MKKLLVLLMMVSGAAQAATATQTDRLFDVEVLIFKRAVEPSAAREAWPDELTDINFSGAHSFDDANYRSDKGVKMLGIDEYQLTEYKDKLNQHAGYDVLFHEAWQQPDLSRANAPSFLITAGKDYSGQYTPQGLHYDEADLKGESERTLPAQEVVGKLKVYINHYLFLESQLDLNIPTIQDVEIEAIEPNETQALVTEETVAEAAEVNETQTLSVLDIQEDETTQFGGFERVTTEVITTEVLKAHRFEQRRKMRSGEIHYLDHPLMGIVIQVRRAN